MDFWVLATVSPGVRWLAVAAGVALVGTLWTVAAWRPIPAAAPSGPPPHPRWKWNLIEGADGTPSTSKFQWALWTGVIVASYLALWIARAAAGSATSLPNMPASLLTAMGLSSVTMAAAKGITGTQTTSPNPRVVKPTNGPGGLFADDNGYPDLSKMQLVAWTLIAVGVFVTAVAHQLIHGSYSRGLPDIDPALVVLMGLGQAAYLGKKLVTTTTPILNGISPPSGSGGTPVTLTGSGFGATQGGSVLVIDNKPIAVAISPGDWTDASIRFAMPATAPGGAAWVAGTVVRIAVIVQGQSSANSLPFTFT